MTLQPSREHFALSSLRVAYCDQGCCGLVMVGEVDETADLGLKLPQIVGKFPVALIAARLAFLMLLCDETKAHEPAITPIELSQMALQMLMNKANPCRPN